MASLHGRAVSKLDTIAANLTGMVLNGKKGGRHWTVGEVIEALTIVRSRIFRLAIELQAMMAPRPF